MGDAEDHGLGRSILELMAVDLEPHVQVLRVGNFIFGNEPRADRAECVGALPFYPLAGPFELEGALGEIVHHAIAGHVVQRFGFLDVFRFFADDYAEFDFPVGFDGIAGNDHVVVGAADRGCGFHEDDWFGGNFHAGFGGVIGIIEADADEFADAADAGADAGSAGDERERRRIESGDALEGVGREGFACEIGDYGGEVADLVGFVEQAGFFFAGLTVAQEFHFGSDGIWS